MARLENELGISQYIGSPAPAERAITLIETVIASGVVIVLVLCVASTTGNVRERSKNSVCLNNLSRIGYANLIYAANDPTDPALPVHGAYLLQDPGNPSCLGEYEWGGKSGVGQQGFVEGAVGENDILTSRYGTKAGFGPATRPLNDILYGGGLDDHLIPEFDPEGAAADTQLDLFLNRCPSDNGYTGIHRPAFRDERRTSFDHYGTSYAASLFRTSWVGGGPIFSNSPYLHRLSDVVAPATTIAYMENNGRFAWDASPHRRRARQSSATTAPPAPSTVGTARTGHLTQRSWTDTPAPFTCVGTTFRRCLAMNTNKRVRPALSFAGKTGSLIRFHKR